MVAKGQTSKFVAITLIITLLVAMTSLGGFVVLVYANPGPSSSMYGEAGIYPGAPSFTIWREDSTYYAKNDYGQIPYSGSDAFDVINSVIYSLPTATVKLPYAGAYINAPYGKIVFREGNFSIGTRITIPLGSRILLEGAGTTFQPAEVVQSGGGTRIVSSNSDGVLACVSGGTLTNGTDVSSVTGTYLWVHNIEFVQNVQQNSSTSSAVYLNGMAGGTLQDVAIVSYRNQDTRWQGYGVEHQTYGLSDYVQYNNVQIYGFQVAFVMACDHFFARGLGLGASYDALLFAPTIAHIQDLHIFASYRAMRVTTTGVVPTLIDSLYMESNGQDTPTNNNFDSLAGAPVTIIRRVYAVSGGNETWTFGNYPEKFEFHQVDTAGGTPAYADAYTPDVPASTVTRTMNVTNVVEIYVTGGTVTVIAVNGITTGLTSGTFLLHPSDTIAITYSSVPTWVWRSIDV